MHHIFQKTGMPPDDFLAKPPGVQAFMLASMTLEIENTMRANGEEVPDGD